MLQLPLRKKRTKSAARLRDSLRASQRSSSETTGTASPQSTDATDDEQEEHRQNGSVSTSTSTAPTDETPQLRADNVRDRLFSLTPLSGPECEASDALEGTTSAPRSGRCSHVGCTVHPQNSPLSGEELRGIFSGAPHFLLEKGTRSHWFPHVLFPWDESTRIQNLQDRKPLHHASFTLSTLHAHLPAFLERRKTGGGAQDMAELESSKYPAFDIGVFEVPNMLSSRAKEIG
ncbi:hypothetical protein FQN49_003141, partial [Arthroderma sp. PD_2]